METKKIYDLIIIGAGPAGLTAAIYARRAQLETMILEGEAPGGKIIKTAEIENWPGTSQINGADLALNMFQHAMDLGTVYESGLVDEIINGEEYKEIVCKDNQRFYAKTIIIATGTQERKLGVPGEEQYASRGVSYCAVCDGTLFTDKKVCVVGGGNSALEESLYLTKYVKHLNIIIRRDVFRADKKIQDAIDKNEKISVIKKSVPVEVIGNGQKVTGLKIKNVDTNEETIVETDGIFPFIGLDPMTFFAQKLGITNEAGYLEVDEHMATKIPGIYGAGDVVDKPLRQVITAANDGAVAAQSISKYLEKGQ